MGRGQRLALILAAIAVAVVGFVVLRPSDDDDEPKRPSTATEETRPETDPDEPKPKPKPKFEVVRIAGGEAQGGMREITVKKGETARIEVRSDTPDELHLHGYDVSKPVAPGKPARFTIKANAEGVFELEAHDLGQLIVAELVVEP